MLLDESDFVGYGVEASTHDDRGTGIGNEVQRKSTDHWRNDRLICSIVWLFSAEAENNGARRQL